MPGGLIRSKQCVHVRESESERGIHIQLSQVKENQDWKIPNELTMSSIVSLSHTRSHQQAPFKQAQGCENKVADSPLLGKRLQKRREGWKICRKDVSNDVQMEQPQLSVTKGQLQ